MAPMVGGSEWYCRYASRAFTSVLSLPSSSTVCALSSFNRKQKVISHNNTIIQSITMTRSARRTSSLGSDSPEFVDGMSSRGHILDPEIQREIWQRSPFALPSDDKRVVYRKTVAGLFSMAHYYDHFADHPNFLRILADDMNWRHATVTFLIKRFVWSRIDYLRTAPTSNFIPNNASAECRNLCELVDKYRSIARNMRRYTITANRSQYINATRDIWKQQLLRDPQILLVQRPPLPHKPRVDWVQSSGGVHGAPFNGNRERSPSPLSQTSNPGHGYRMRSPEQRPRRHCSLSPQAHIKQRNYSPPM